MRKVNNYGDAPRYNCGIEPKGNAPIFEFTTVQIKGFLQGEMNKLTSRLRSDKDGRWKFLGDYKISLITSKLSDSYVAFYLILPSSIQKGSKQFENVPDVFKPPTHGDSVTMEKPIYEYLSALMYDKDEKGFFRTESARRMYNLRKNEANLLYRFLTPKKTKIKDANGEENLYIVAALDPLRVFKEMIALVSDSDSSGNNKNKKLEEERYKTKIKVAKNIDKDNMLFEVWKEPEDRMESSYNIGAAFRKSLRSAIGPGN